MDGHQFDGMIRAVAGSRRMVLGGAVAAAAGALIQPESEGKKRRKRCRAPRVKCGKTCLPAGSCCTDADCGACQSCSGKRCVVAPSGTACGVGGTCNGTACINEGAFGCTADLDFCYASSKMPCPRSTTPGAFCVVNGSGKTMCVTGGCIARGTQQDCEAAVGSGAIQQEFCNECALQAPGQDGCFKPVSR